MIAYRLPKVTVLFDPLDDATVTGTLLTRHNPAAGVIVVHPTPGRTSETTLAMDLMDALGHPTGRLADERIGGLETLWTAVTAWCDGAAITHLVVLRAHLLSTRQHERLLVLWRARHPAHGSATAGRRPHLPGAARCRTPPCAAPRRSRRHRPFPPGVRRGLQADAPSAPSVGHAVAAHGHRVSVRQLLRRLLTFRAVCR